MTDLTFGKLVDSIRSVHEELAARAGKAVNVSLTLRNWLIGLYIAEYELQGADRANYGDKLLADLAKELKSYRISNTGHRQMYRYLSFYKLYPQILRALPPKSQHLIPENIQASGISPTVSAKLTTEPEILLNSLSYSHLEQLIQIEDPLKRAFYEMESIRGVWSLRELKRQIASLYYERSGLSKNKKKLAEMVQANAEESPSQLTIRDPYIFEFLGLKSKEVMGESDLEDALLDKLQEFLLELGHGFCFESRQKRILIGNKHYFVDLVFYHRILKCHVLVDLKLENFNHENIGQLNTYISWYAKNEMTTGDNPPVGILLCTQKDHALAEYALAGMDDNLFVSKYQLELPKKEEMQQFLEEQMKEEEMNE